MHGQDLPIPGRLLDLPYCLAEARQQAFEYRKAADEIIDPTTLRDGAVPTFTVAAEFAIVTAVRSGEVRGAVWEEIDLDAGLWTIPGDRMKAGRQHRVPLSGRAVEVLAEVRGHSTGSGLVFPSKSGGETP